MIQKYIWSDIGIRRKPVLIGLQLLSWLVTVGSIYNAI